MKTKSISWFTRVLQHFPSSTFSKSTKVSWEGCLWCQQTFKTNRIHAKRASPCYSQRGMNFQNMMPYCTLWNSNKKHFYFFDVKFGKLWELLQYKQENNNVVETRKKSQPGRKHQQYSRRDSCYASGSPPLEVKCCHACHRRPDCRTIAADLRGWCVNYDTIDVSHNPYIRASKLHSHFQFTPQCPERSGPDLSPIFETIYHLAETDRMTSLLLNQ